MSRVKKGKKKSDWWLVNNCKDVPICKNVNLVVVTRLAVYWVLYDTFWCGSICSVERLSKPILPVCCSYYRFWTTYVYITDQIYKFI